MNTLDNLIGIVQREKISVSELIEIGSRDGHDTHYICNKLNIQKAVIIEAHKDCFLSIKKTYPQYHTFNIAAYNKEGFLAFNEITTGDAGISSLKDRNDNYYDGITRKSMVQTCRVESFLKEHNFKPDIAKIDVEGCTYEVLEGFGENIQDLKILHIEHEHWQVWKDQKIYKDIKNFLEDLRFKQIFFYYIGPDKKQSDSIWIK
jgi:FkbM family methyltransferase